MSDFSHIDEKEFLQGYINFTIKIRPFIISKITEQYQQMINNDEKQMYKLLAIEQLFLFYETFAGFFQAFIKRNQTPILMTLGKNINAQNLIDTLRGKNIEDILRELNLPLENYNQKQCQEIKRAFTKLITLLQDEDSYKLLKDILIPIFNKLKHKMLVYKSNGNIKFVFDKDAHSQITKYINDTPQNFTDNLMNTFNSVAKVLMGVLRILIALRLKELTFQQKNS